jgi:hypothetical protein
MLTSNTGKRLKTSIEELQGGMQTYRNTIMKSNMFLERRIYQQMYYHDRLE